MNSNMGTNNHIRDDNNLYCALLSTENVWNHFRQIYISLDLNIIRNHPRMVNYDGFSAIWMLQPLNQSSLA